jgi:transcriptional regulator with XRE-family HTH domain
LIVVKNPELLKQDLTSDGRTMTYIAKKLKCSKAYISSIVAGTRRPNAKVAIGICELLERQFNRYFFITSVNKELTKNESDTVQI